MSGGSITKRARQENANNDPPTQPSFLVPPPPIFCALSFFINPQDFYGQTRVYINTSTFGFTY